MAFKHIVVGTDFSECSQRALALGMQLAEESHAKLTIVHVLQVPSYSYGAGIPYMDYFKPLREAAEKCLGDALARAIKTLPGACSVLRLGSPAEELLGVASDGGADLIIVGTHGRRGMAHLFMGSVAERIVRTSPIAVLTVRDEAEHGRRAP